jgi:putative tricarboxylic transport membrane protein
VVLALILGLVISNIVASTLGLLSANLLARITLIDIRYIVPIVLSLCFVGAYTMRENIWDVLLVVIAGFFGYGMIRYGFSQICLVIGLVLGILAEKSFHQSLMISFGSYGIFFKRPISLILMLLLALLIILPFLKMRFGSKETGNES